MANFCGYYNENICRSCSLLETPYDQQILLKEERLRKILPEGFLLEKSVLSSGTAFRNKAKLIVSGTSEHPILGLIDREILDCPVHDPVINSIVKDLVPFIRAAKLEPYNIPAKKGELKGVILFHGEEAYVRFVLRSKESLDRIRKNLPSLLAVHPEIRAVSVNIQPVHQAILEGEEEIPLGPHVLVEQSYEELRIKLRPQGFVQTNQVVASRLYATAATWVKGLGIGRFLEIFSGQGAFSFHCARFVQEATGVEINPEAVKTAEETANDLGLTHLHFMALDAAKSGEIICGKRPELILVNPPRRGLGESLKLILEADPRWVIYSSCSVESLEKDLRALGKKYLIRKVQLFDMFPHTEHFETLVLLENLSAIKP